MPKQLDKDVDKLVSNKNAFIVEAIQKAVKEKKLEKDLTGKLIAQIETTRQRASEALESMDREKLREVFANVDSILQDYVTKLREQPRQKTEEEKANERLRKLVLE